MAIGGDHDKKTCQHKDECLPCKIKAHAFWSPQCQHFMTWRENKQQKGQWIGESPTARAFGVTSHALILAPIIPSAPPCPPLSDVQSKLIIALQAQLATTQAQLAAYHDGQVKKRLLDSDANISILSTPSHMDPNTFPIMLRADKPSVVETANNSTMAIQGRGN